MCVAEQAAYNVVCRECGNVFTVHKPSPLWWRAKKRDDQGYLDALQVEGKDCGCVPERAKSDAPYRVFGYDGMCVSFDIPCETFIEALRAYRRHKHDVVFISGVSPTVERELNLGFFPLVP